MMCAHETTLAVNDMTTVGVCTGDTGRERVSPLCIRKLFLPHLSGPRFAEPVGAYHWHQLIL